MDATDSFKPLEVCAKKKTFYLPPKPDKIRHPIRLVSKREGEKKIQVTARLRFHAFNCLALGQLYSNLIDRMPKAFEKINRVPN